MKYKSRFFFLDGYSVNAIAKKYLTPIYCYSFNKIKKNIKTFNKNFKNINHLSCFSVKSNPNKTLLKEIGKLGFGADVVSIGELMRALKSGIKPSKIVFSGVGKDTFEIDYAINKKILLINAESESEILEIERLAKLKKRKVSIGIRLNPNVDANTLSQISTGKKENKFGVSEKVFIKLFNYVKRSKYLTLKCLSVHIGSQILDHKPYQKMLGVLDKLIKKINYQFDYIDLGGGMGIDYKKDNRKLNFKKYSKEIKKFQKKHHSRIIFEPGRSIIGNAGVLISKIIYIKKGRDKDFIILDAAMNDLMRPALYNAFHQIMPAVKSNKRIKKTYEFVGPICESTDKFLTTKTFQTLNEKDLVIILDVGAYGMSLSSNYNLRPKALELLIKKSKIQIINRRQNLRDLI